MLRLRAPALAGLLLLALLSAAAPAGAHQVSCDPATTSCLSGCLVHGPPGINHACTVEGVEIFQTYSCFPEGVHVEVLGVPLRRCGPPSALP